MELLLVPIDFSAGTEKVLAAAHRLAVATGATLRLLHVAPPDPDFVPYDAGPALVRKHVAHTLRAEHRRLHELAVQFSKDGVQTTARMVMGPFIENIVEQAKQSSADRKSTAPMGTAPCSVSCLAASAREWCAKRIARC